MRLFVYIRYSRCISCLVSDVLDDSKRKARMGFIGRGRLQYISSGFLGVLNQTTLGCSRFRPARCSVECLYVVKFGGVHLLIIIAPFFDVSNWRGPIMSATDVLSFRCAKNVSNCLGSLLTSSNVQMCQECQQLPWQMSCHSDVPIMSATDVLSFRCANNVSNRCLVIQMCQECQQLPWQMSCHSDVPRMSATA
jgi:hypothetical protein